MVLGTGVVAGIIWFHAAIASPAQYARMIASSRLPLGSGPFLLFTTGLAGLGGLGLIFTGLGIAVDNTSVTIRKLGLLMCLCAVAVAGMGLLGLLL